MNDVENTLAAVIDHFVILQTWGAKPQALRKPSGAFQSILALDKGLKKLRKADKAHPLQELAKEIRTAFDTREYRAVLLDAFNWRAKLRKEAEAKKADKPVAAVKTTSLKLANTKTKNRQTHASEHKSRKKPTAMDPKMDQFVRNCLAFLNSVSEETRRQIRARNENRDMFTGWRRLPGNYGG